MKKLFTILALTIFTSGVFAQSNQAVKVTETVSSTSNEEGSSYSSTEYKPMKGSVTTEVGLTGGLSSSYNLNTQGNVSLAPILRFRYFQKDNLAFRVGFSLVNEANSDSSLSTAVINFPITAPSTAIVITNTKKDSYTSFDINLGIEKHFKGSDRLSTYVGADILFGFKSASEESTDNPFGTTTTTKGSNSIQGKDGNKYFGVRFVTGADYYIAKKVYLGLEIGLSIVSESLKDKVTNVVKTNPFTDVTSDITTTVSDRKSEFNIKPEIVGGIKIGYQF